MKKLVCCLLILSIAVSLCGCGEQPVNNSVPNNATKVDSETKTVDPAEEKEEILFNKIPWGSSYKETISILKEKFSVDFVGAQDLVINKLDKWKDILPGTGFYVISTSSVKIAEEDAYILLRFAFPNDGKEITVDFDNAIFEEAKYLFDLRAGECNDNNSWVKKHSSNYYNGEDFIHNYAQYTFRDGYFLESSEREEIAEKLILLLIKTYGGDDGKHYYRQNGAGGSGVICSDHDEFNIESQAYWRCALNAVSVTYFGDSTTSENNKEIRSELGTAFENAKEQERIDSMLNTDSSGL